MADAIRETLYDALYRKEIDPYNIGIVTCPDFDLTHYLSALAVFKRDQPSFAERSSQKDSDLDTLNNEFKELTSARRVLSEICKHSTKAATTFVRAMASELIIQDFTLQSPGGEEEEKYLARIEYSTYPPSICARKNKDLFGMVFGSSAESCIAGPGGNFLFTQMPGCLPNISHYFIALRGRNDLALPSMCVLTTQSIKNIYDRVQQTTGLKVISFREASPLWSNH